MTDGDNYTDGYTEGYIPSVLLILASSQNNKAEQLPLAPIAR